MKRKRRGKLTPLSRQHKSQRREKQTAKGSTHAARVWARRHVAGDKP